jgi:hypothetical protein
MRKAALSVSVVLIILAAGSEQLSPAVRRQSVSAPGGDWVAIAGIFVDGLARPRDFLRQIEGESSACRFLGYLV